MGEILIDTGCQAIQLARMEGRFALAELLARAGGIDPQRTDPARRGVRGVGLELFHRYLPPAMFPRETDLPQSRDLKLGTIRCGFCEKKIIFCQGELFLLSRKFRQCYLSIDG